VSLDAVYRALHEDDDWRRATRRRVIAGDEVIGVGEWAQLGVERGRVTVAFPTYPSPPAYDVARLMRFLAERGFDVEVLPGTAFRTP
jgi:hypothetical protein